MSRPVTAAWWLALASVAGLACNGRSRAIGGQPSWRQSTAVAPPIAATGLIELHPHSGGARAYNDPPRTPVPPDPLGDAVVAEVMVLAAQRSVPPPAADGRLFAAARDIASVVPSESVVPYPLVEFALQHQGIIEPSPHLLVVWGPLGSPALLVEELRPRLREVLEESATSRIGVGWARRADTDVLVVALQASFVETRPIPRHVGVDGRLTVDAKILGAYRDPEVFVTRPDGRVERLEGRNTDGGIAAEIGCGGRGRHQVEITASDHTGSTVLANFPVWCGDPPPASLAAAITLDDSAPVASATDAEARMMTLVNRDRASANLPPLEPDARLAAVARAHSREMRATGVVGHVSAATGTAADRVRAAGIRTGLVLENIARAYGIGEAEAGLMNSPGHRANLLSAAATHIGIGIDMGTEVSGRRELFVTQVFTRIPPAIDTKVGQEAVRERLRAGRSFRDDAGLERIAATYARALATGQPDPAAAARQAARDREQHAKRFARVDSVVMTVTDLDAVDAAAIFGEAQFSHVGVGVAQGDHPELGPGALYVVVLFGERR